jgi:hypothetical protein
MNDLRPDSIERAVRRCQPRHEDLLLLRAGLGDGDEALAAWREFQARYEGAPLNLGTLRLLPLAHHNLSAQDANPNLRPETADVLSRMWCETQIAFDMAATLLRALHELSIEVMVLKGVALAWLDYPEPALRPMTDVDLFVRAEDAPRVFDLLRERGWRSHYSPAEALLPFFHAALFVTDWGAACDVHWRMGSYGQQLGGAFDDFIDAAVAFEVNGAPALAPCAADRLLHACVHGMEANPMSPARWIADATRVIRSADTSLDWARVLEQTRRRDLTVPMRAALSALRSLGHAQIPAAVVDEIGAARASWMQKAIFRERSAGRRRFTRVYEWICDWRALEGSSPARKAYAFWRFLVALVRVEWRRLVRRSA